MHLCVFHPCPGPGHATGHDALVHGQDAILSAMRELDTKVSTIMTTVDQVAADFATYKIDVTDAFARLKASLDAGSTDAAALDALDAAIKGADAEAVAVDATPLTDGGEASADPADDDTDATPLTDPDTAPVA